MGWKSEVAKQDLDFEVAKATLYVRRHGQQFNLKNDANRVALWNDTDNELLSLVSTGYKPITHISVINALENALEKLNMEPINPIKYLATPNKNKMWAIVDLKTIGVELDSIRDVEDEWTLGITVIHGLDAYAGLLIMPAITRMICSNGLWVRKLLGVQKITHRTDDLVVWFGENIGEVLSELDERFRLIPKLYGLPIAREDFLTKVHKRFGKQYMEDVMLQLDSPSETNPLYQVTPESLSLYDAMSVLTFVNKEKASEVGAYLIEQRHIAIERLIQSELYQG